MTSGIKNSFIKNSLYYFCLLLLLSCSRIVNKYVWYCFLYQNFFQPKIFLSTDLFIVLFLIVIHYLCTQIFYNLFKPINWLKHFVKQIPLFVRLKRLWISQQQQQQQKTLIKSSNMSILFISYDIFNNYDPEI